MYTQITDQQGEVISHSDCASQTPELLGPGKGAKRRPNQQGEVISHSDCASQTPEPLGTGKGTKRRPNQICTSEDYLSA